LTGDLSGGTGPATVGASLAGRTLLVLGSASPSKRGVFEAARRRQARVVLVKHGATWERDYCAAVLDWDCADYRGLDRALPRIGAFARDWAVDGAVATADAALPTLAELSRSADLPGPGAGLVATLRDKARMRRCFEDLGLPSAVSIPARTQAEAVAAADVIGLPVIVKPAFGTGSIGVVLARDTAELRRACRLMARVCAASGRQGAFVVEEFVGGPEVCVDAIVHDGDILFQNILDKPRPMNGPLFEEVEFVTPSNAAPEAAGHARELNTRLIRGMGVRTGIVHTEIRISDHGPRLIETHLRPAGQRLPDIVRRTTGVDIFEAAVELAMGVRPAIEPRPGGYAGYQCVYSSRSGTLRAVHGLGNAEAVPGIYGVEVVTAIGERIETLPEHTQQNIAYIHAEGPDYDYVRRQLSLAAAAVTVEVR
jgi:biotin carboxylase